MRQDKQSNISWYCRVLIIIIIISISLNFKTEVGKVGKDLYYFSVITCCLPTTKIFELPEF